MRARPYTVPPMPAVRWGLTLPFAGLPLRDHLDLFRRAEELGYDDLWTGETAGPDGFTPLAMAAAVTERIRLATGIVNPYTRGPALLAQQAAALQDASGGRFVLGIGSSSNVIVERWNEIPFVKPLSKVRESVEGLQKVFAGERGAGGFKLETPPATADPDRHRGAARQDARAGRRARRRRVHELPAAVGPAAGPGGVRRDDKELACRFFCVPMPEEQGMGLAKHLFAAYGTVPVYAAFFRWLGWAEQLDPMVEAWQAGDRKQALELCPEDLVREIFVFGEPEEMKERLGQFVDGGITTLILTPIAAPDQVPALIDALAP